MDLSQIHYFLNLAETLNFTEAARMSGISQPSLTKAIQRLEEELGGALLYRDGKDTRLSALGRDLVVEFMRVQSAIEAVKELADNSVAGRRRRISLGIVSTLAPQAFSRFLSHVMKELPDLELHLYPMLPGESEAEILSGKYDLCFLTAPPSPHVKLSVQPLFEEPLHLAVASAHSLASRREITPEQMMAEPYIDRLHCEFRTQLIKHFMDRNIVMRPRLQSEREDWVQHLVAEGLGVCSLPARSTIVEGIVVRPVKGLSLSRKVTMAAVSGSGNPREVRLILGMAKAFDWRE